MSGSEISQVRRRVRRAIDQDGLFEMTMGVIFLAVPLLVRLRLQSIAGVVAVVLVCVVLPVLRNRVTYPRVGYAKPREPAFRLILLFALGLGVVSLGVTALVLLVQGRVMSRPAWLALMPFATGLFIAGFHFLWGIRTRSLRHFILASVAAAGGALAVLLAAGSLDTGAGIFFLGFGTLELATGIVLLTRFLSHYPRPQGATDDA
ncbi:MAG: hypothetical protein JSU73_04135 [candidate division WOR-3 bacterium]|nr:MAG: hypothetical protein JSU73_04135 [candidate division WOR-3 bacterium]